ncbi:MAG: ATP-binding protein [Candidatus ainarchaeum sp.]|nr:ATP-binding protein [Candidatus ainarchaeum sp.]
MIKRVVLENWRTHAKSEFEFEKGTNVLVGQMGSGKSSVMDAICFALFGTFPALQAKRVSLEEIITSKPNKENFARVMLEFDYAGKNFVVERTIKRKGTNEAKLSCDGKFLAGPKTTDATAAIEQCLDINYDLFSRAVYSEQNQIDYFLKLSPSQRKIQFDELLDLQKYENARSNSVSISNRLKDSIAERKSWLESRKKNLDEKEITATGQKIRQKQKEQEEARKKIVEKKAEVEKLRELGAKLEKQWKEFRALRERLVSGEATAKELRRSIAEAARLLEGKSPEKIAKEAIEKEKEIEKILEEEKLNESEIGTIQENANSLIREQGLFEEKILQIEKALRELKQANANCPVCKRDLSGHTKKELQEENGLEKEAIEKKQDALIEKMKKLKAELDKKNSLKKKFAANREKTKAEIIELKSLLREIESEKKNREKEEKQLSQLELENEKLSREIEKTCFDEENLKKHQKALAEASAAVQGIENEKKSNNELLAELEAGLKKAEEEKKQVAELEQSIGRLSKAQEKGVLFTNSLIAAQGELREELVENTNIAMDNIWQKIYPYGDFTSARLEIEKGSYELKVRGRDSNWVRVEGILSGGERSAAALCIRIAFSLVLTQNLSWLILDEPTHNLDRQAVSILGKIMREQLPELVEQIFIITHDREMENAASGSIYVLKRDKENDGATVPEKSGIFV